MSVRITALLLGAALAFIGTVASSAPIMPTIERLRGCLSIDNMTKERLNCYDAIVPPEPIAAAPKAKTVLECRFLREEDERIICFNGFLSNRAFIAPAVASPKTSIAPTTVTPNPPKQVWIRTDGQRVTGNEKLQQQFDTDRAECLTKLGQTIELFKYCMSLRRYEMVLADEAEKLLAAKRAATILPHTTIVTTSHTGGCGSRGGPGYRLSNGKCASHSSRHRH
jgi:hypothetical protein